MLFEQSPSSLTKKALRPVAVPVNSIQLANHNTSKFWRKPQLLLTKVMGQMVTAASLTKKALK